MRDPKGILLRGMGRERRVQSVEDGYGSKRDGGGMNKEPRRFGITAMSKGFITLEQFAEAVKIQAGEDLAETETSSIIIVPYHWGHSHS